MRAGAGSGTARLATVVVACGTVAYGLVATGIAARHGHLTTYAGRSPAAAGTELAAGWALVAAGLLTWRRRPRRLAGPLAVAGGLAVFAPDWIGWETGPGAVRALGLAAQGVAAAAVLHITLGAIAGGAFSASARACVGATWAATAAIGAARTLLYDPLADPGCAVWCAANPLLARGDRPLVRALDWADLGLAALMLCALGALGAQRLRRAAPATRGRLWPVLAPAVLVLAGWLMRAAVVAARPGEDPALALFTVAFAVRAGALVALGAALSWALGTAVRGALAVRRLAREASAGGSLEDALRRATGDGSLRIAFPVDREEGWVDARGEPLDAPRRGPGRAVTEIVREGRGVAWVLHDPAILDGPALERQIGTAARLAVDNERLRAEARVQLRELRASRARVVQTGDTERRRLERDLHDGAQQRLVGLAMALRMAQASIGSGLDPGADRALQDAQHDLRAALADLRDVARGIHPVELTEEGLAAAFEALGDRAPVLLGSMPAGRLPEAVETAAYVMVDEAVRRAAGRPAPAVLTVHARESDGRLVVEVEDPGDPSAPRALADLAAVADRAGALDGSLTARAAHPRGVRLRMELPCAW